MSRSISDRSRARSIPTPTTVAMVRGQGCPRTSPSASSCAAEGATVANGTFRSTDALNDPAGVVIRQTVSADQAGDVWECRVRNRSKESIRCGAIVSFVDEGIQTELPLVAAQPRPAPTHRGDRADPPCRRTTGDHRSHAGAPGVRQRGHRRDRSNCRSTCRSRSTTSTSPSSAVRARTVVRPSGCHRPCQVRNKWRGNRRFRFMEIPLDINVDFSRLAITIDVTLRGTGDPGRRRIEVTPAVKIDHEAFVDGFRGIGLGPDPVSKLSNKIGEFRDEDRGRAQVGRVPRRRASVPDRRARPPGPAGSRVRRSARRRRRLDRRPSRSRPGQAAAANPATRMCPSHDQRRYVRRPPMPRQRTSPRSITSSC